MLLFFLGLVRIFGPSPSKKVRSTTIHIVDGKYKAYYFPRMFFNYEAMKDKKQSRITEKMAYLVLWL